MGQLIRLGYFQPLGLFALNLAQHFGDLRLDLVGLGDQLLSERNQLGLDRPIGRRLGKPDALQSSFAQLVGAGHAAAPLRGYARLHRIDGGVAVQPLGIISLVFTNQISRFVPLGAAFLICAKSRELRTARERASRERRGDR
jgi:hypothetical protein